MNMKISGSGLAIKNKGLKQDYVVNNFRCPGDDEPILVCAWIPIGYFKQGSYILKFYPESTLFLHQIQASGLLTVALKNTKATIDSVALHNC